MQINFNNQIKSKLLQYQVPHVKNIIDSLKRYNRCLDASDTGTGKTFSAIGVAKAMGLKPFIICPKSVIVSWLEVLKFFDCPYYGISNYELIQNCKYYPPNNSKTECSYVRRRPFVLQKKKKYLYTWNLPKDVLVIFDEAHRCKNKDTNTSSILFTVCQKSCKILLLSATIADKPETFEVCGYVLGLYSNIRHAKSWIRSLNPSSLRKDDQINPMLNIHNRLYNDLKIASRMKKKDLNGLFSENDIKCECLDMECSEEIQLQYKLIEKSVEELKKQEEQSVALGQIVKARMRIEMLRVPTFLKLAKEYLEDGKAVVIFVNFTNTLRTLADELDTTCIIVGGQTIDERNSIIRDFNEDNSHIIICNMRSGGVGISLHDTNGNYPRISIISPSWSAQSLLQALGRVHRAKSKTPVIQKIIFCKNTIEERICQVIKEKIENIAALNDGNLQGYHIQGLIDGALDEPDQVSDFDKLFAKIKTLYAKKNRLIEDLKDTENEIQELEREIRLMV